MRFEENAPVTLNEMYSQARSCRQTVELADARQRAFKRLLPLDQYSHIIITSCGSSLLNFHAHYLRPGARALLLGGDAAGHKSQISNYRIAGMQSEIFLPALYARVGKLLTHWRAAARKADPDAPPHLARTVAPNV